MAFQSKILRRDRMFSALVLVSSSMTIAGKLRRICAGELSTPVCPLGNDSTKYATDSPFMSLAFRPGCLSCKRPYRRLAAATATCN